MLVLQEVLANEFLEFLLVNSILVLMLFGRWLMKENSYLFFSMSFLLSNVEKSDYLAVNLSNLTSPYGLLKSLRIDSPAKTLV